MLPLTRSSRPLLRNSLSGTTRLSDSRMTSLDKDAPFWVIGADWPGPWLITCDHATNRVPSEVGSLGLPQDDMARHIAYDIGAFGVCLALADALKSPMIATNFSRLVIDPNRGEDDPTLLMRLYDGSVIPGNAQADQHEKTLRLNAYHRPYHAAYAELATKAQAICAVHSFTPQLKSRPPRPWQIGILHADDTRLSDPFIARLAAEPDLIVGRNEPYSGHLPGDSIDRHALAFGRHNTLIELRQDLIETQDQQSAWATRLAPMLTAALGDAHAQS